MPRLAASHNKMQLLPQAMCRAEQHHHQRESPLSVPQRTGTRGSSDSDARQNWHSRAGEQHRVAQRREQADCASPPVERDGDGQRRGQAARRNQQLAQRLARLSQLRQSLSAISHETNARTHRGNCGSIADRVKCRAREAAVSHRMHTNARWGTERGKSVQYTQRAGNKHQYARFPKRRQEG